MYTHFAFSNHKPVATAILKRNEQEEAGREQINNRQLAPLGMTRGAARGCDGPQGWFSTQVRILVPGLEGTGPQAIPWECPESCLHDMLCLAINYIIAGAVLIALCVSPVWGLNSPKAGTVSVWFMAKPPGTVSGTQ